MWKLQTLLLLLGLLWLSMAVCLAESTNNKPHHDYDLSAEMARRFPKNNRGKSDNDVVFQQQPATIQKYWQNFVRSIPFRLNMTNFFNAGTQQILETPVAAHHDVEPNRRRRRRKNPTKKKSSTMKKNKEPKTSNYREYETHDNLYRRASGTSLKRGYHQLQLQALGMDVNHVMHFYDPSTGSYYALQYIASPQKYYHQRPLFLPHTDDDDDYPEVDGNGSEEQEDTEEHHEELDAHEESSVEASEDYSDDIEIADENWGYSDEDIFGERKLKTKPFNLKVFGGQDSDSVERENLANALVSIHKDLLKPETEEDVKLLLNGEDGLDGRQAKYSPPPTSNVESRRSSKRRIKPSSVWQTPEERETEMVRNILGSFMKDDSTNRRRQSTVPKTVKPQRLVEQPRERRLYFIYPRYR